MLQVQESLKKHDASAAEEAQSLAPDIGDKSIDMNIQNDGHKVKKENPGKRGERRELLLVVATLITTVTFQAAVNPPPTVWQQGTKLNVKCIFEKYHAKLQGPTHLQNCPALKYYWFMIMNTTGFLCSVLSIPFLVFAYFVDAGAAVLSVSFITMVINYIVLLGSMSPDGLSLLVTYSVSISILVFCPFLNYAVFKILASMLPKIKKSLPAVIAKHLDAEKDR